MPDEKREREVDVEDVLAALGAIAVTAGVAFYEWRLALVVAGAFALLAALVIALSRRP